MQKISLLTSKERGKYIDNLNNHVYQHLKTKFLKTKEFVTLDEKQEEELLIAQIKKLEIE